MRVVGAPPRNGAAGGQVSHVRLVWSEQHSGQLIGTGDGSPQRPSERPPPHRLGEAAGRTGAQPGTPAGCRPTDDEPSASGPGNPDQLALRGPTPAPDTRPDRLSSRISRRDRAPQG